MKVTHVRDNFSLDCSRRANHVNDCVTRNGCFTLLWYRRHHNSYYYQQRQGRRRRWWWWICPSFLAIRKISWSDPRFLGISDDHNLGRILARLDHNTWQDPDWIIGRVSCNQNLGRIFTGFSLSVGFPATKLLAGYGQEFSFPYEA